MVPFGAGSSLEGHVNALSGGVSIDLSRMNRVLRVNVEDLDVSVEAGVTQVKPTLFFEFHGTSQAGVTEHATTVQEIAADHGAGEFLWATTTEDRARLWHPGDEARSAGVARVRAARRPRR